MSKPIRVLIVEDSEDDALLVLDEIRRGGYDPTFERVDTREAMDTALDKKRWDVILADYRIPHFSGLGALRLLQEKKIDLPFIIVSATIGEEKAVEAMKAGAHDYLMKDNLHRLCVAVKREMAEAENRAERRNAEKKLVKLQRRLLVAKNEWENTFDAISDLISIHDADFNLIRCNKAFKRLTGLNVQDLIGKKCYQVFHDKDEPKCECPLAACMKSLKPETGEMELPKFGGIYLVSCFPIFDSNSKIKGIVHIAKDVTERKRERELLLESEEKFKSICRSANDAIIMLDNDDCVSFWNDAAERLFGFSRREIIGEKIYETIIPAGLRASHIKGFNGFRDTGQGAVVDKTVELITIKKDGTEFSIELSLSSVKIDGKWNAIGIVRDITERKQSEEQIKEGIEKQKTALEGIINTLALTVEQRDPYTSGHQKRVSNLSCLIAGEIGLSNDQIEGIRLAGIVHDIGKMHIPAEILSRPGKLTKDEFSIVRSHAQVSYDILAGTEFPWPVADIVHQHHERMDGSGYPQGLSNGDILMEARILCVADVVEAMSSHRPYRPALGLDKAIEEISRGKGIHYDPDVVDACIKVVKKEGFEFEASSVESMGLE